MDGIENNISEPSTVQQNERVKLTDTWLNGLSVAILAFGGIAQSFTLLGSIERAKGYHVAAVVMCIVASPLLHWWARRILRGLK